MRLLGRLLLALLTLALVVPLSLHLQGLLTAPDIPPPVRELGLDSRSSAVYMLDDQQWLTFPLISQTDRVKVLSNLSTEPGTSAELPLQYSLLWQVLDDDQQILAQGSWTHQTRLPPPLSVDGQRVPRNLYARDAALVASAQSFILQLDQLPRAAYLRLRHQSLDAPLLGVAARFYYEERISPQRAAILWERLSQQRREQLAADVIYPPALVLAQERVNLLLRQWQPAGPLETAVPQRRLYYVDDQDDSRPLQARLAGGRLYIAPDRLGVLPISASGDYRLQFQPQDDDTLPAELTLTHYSAQQAEPQRSQLALPEGQGAPLQHIEAGLLLVQSSRPGWLDIRARDDSSLLPEPQHLRARRIQAGQPLRFALSPDGQHNAHLPLRLDLRLWTEGTPLPASQPLLAHYRILDSAGELLDEGELHGMAGVSLFDRISSTPHMADLSDPLSFYLRLPARTAQLEISSTQALLASAWTRPADLPHRTRVPQDYYAWLRASDAQPGWFSLSPPDAAALDEALLHIQSRPPERDPQLLAGRYQWQALAPQRPARGARLLLPVEPGDTPRDSALPGYFVPLASGRQSLELQMPGAHRLLRPQLIWLRDSSAPFSLRLRLNGHEQQHELAGRRGSIALPASAPGRHRLELQASTAGRWLLNYRWPQPGSYQLHLGYALQQQPLQFSLQKRNGEQRLIGARFHSSGAAGVSTRIRLRLQPAGLHTGPSHDWSYHERIYTLVPDAGQAGRGYLLDRQQGQVSTGLPLFFALGDDLAPGPLQVSFERLDGAPGYLLLYEILPGEHARVDSFTEDLP